MGGSSQQAAYLGSLQFVQCCPDIEVILKPAHFFLCIFQFWWPSCFYQSGQLVLFILHLWGAENQIYSNPSITNQYRTSAVGVLL